MIFSSVPWYLIVAMCVFVVVAVITLGTILEDIKRWFNS